MSNWCGISHLLFSLYLLSYEKKPKYSVNAPDIHVIELECYSLTTHRVSHFLNYLDVQSCLETVDTNLP